MYVCMYVYIYIYIIQSWSSQHPTRTGCTLAVFEEGQQSVTQWSKPEPEPPIELRDSTTKCISAKTRHKLDMFMMLMQGNHKVYSY